MEIKIVFSEYPDRELKDKMNEFFRSVGLTKWGDGTSERKVEYYTEAIDLNSTRDIQLKLEGGF